MTNECTHYVLVGLLYYGIEMPIPIGLHSLLSQSIGKLFLVTLGG